MAPHLDINVITVGQDAFSPTELQGVNNLIDRSKVIFARHGLPIRTVRRFHIDVAQAGVLVVPKSDADVAALGERWAVPNDALDVFVVLRMAHPLGYVGSSPQPGSCVKRATKHTSQRAPVVSLTEGDFNASVTFVHEIGHCLDLPHCHEKPELCGPNNFMEIKTGVTRSNFTPAQLQIMKRHCFVKP
jgi:hypothetical protein